MYDGIFLPCRVPCHPQRSEPAPGLVVVGHGALRGDEAGDGGCVVQPQLVVAGEAGHLAPGLAGEHAAGQRPRVAGQLRHGLCQTLARAGRRPHVEDEAASLVGAGQEEAGLQRVDRQGLGVESVEAAESEGGLGPAEPGVHHDHGAGAALADEEGVRGLLGVAARPASGLQEGLVSVQHLPLLRGAVQHA